MAQAARGAVCATRQLLPGTQRPKRLLIVAALRDGESVGDLGQLIGARQSNVSQHLALMRHLGLVESRRADGNVLYRLADPRHAKYVPILFDHLRN